MSRSHGPRRVNRSCSAQSPIFCAADVPRRDLICQDSNQLEALYKDRWEPFLANAGVLQGFTPNDVTTAKWMSERAGQMTVFAPSSSESRSVEKGRTVESASWSQVRRSLYLPQELMGFAEGMGLLWIARMANSVRFFTPPYWKIEQAKARREESVLRALTPLLGIRNDLLLQSNCAKAIRWTQVINSDSMWVLLDNTQKRLYFMITQKSDSSQPLDESQRAARSLLESWKRHDEIAAPKKAQPSGDSPAPPMSEETASDLTGTNSLFAAALLTMHGPT